MSTMNKFLRRHYPYRFIGYNLSLSGTPLSFFAKVGKKFAFAPKIDKKYKVNKNNKSA